jgi:hypothetical protein
VTATPLILVDISESLQVGSLHGVFRVGIAAQELLRQAMQAPVTRPNRL